MKGEKMKFFENGNTQVIALGGLGEVGKNMYVFVHNDLSPFITLLVLYESYKRYAGQSS